ncbi:hypothetical protein [Mycolicibacterium sediminis]|uniref:Uncharacterized protein n=1 Tax=Mycolicibacterium sediminis TaxID=1286180 RepID=A0A7I7QPM4_9MYCO|nr:hypothetical protein [Mycolicibacterium sediminis]BBY28172.1 hypothetical protein MSEDJ_22680 [Mycolicibacterium sediminis]
MIDYAAFSGLSGVYLEDSFVLSIAQDGSSLTFALDAVLTPDHPAYHPPRVGEHHCYEPGTLTFPAASRIDWLRRSTTSSTDAAGETDLGSVDVLRRDGESIVVEGDWGEVHVVGSEPRFSSDG